MSDPVVQAAEALIAQMEAESDALAANDFAAAGAMLTLKEARLAALRMAERQYGLTPGDAALRALSLRLNQAAERNRQALLRALRVQGRVIKIIAAATPQPVLPGYTAQGAPRTAARAPITLRAQA